jgi:hypothetical protein
LTFHLGEFKSNYITKVEETPYDKWSDKKYVLKTVKRNGLHLQYASIELKNDKELIKLSKK